MQHILLLGDSLTEQGYSSHWVSQLQDLYRRRADVVNRGLSGYNTRWMRGILADDGKRKLVLPPPDTSGVLFTVVFFGANDAVQPGHSQHVPLEEFEDNLRAIIALARMHAKPKHGIFVLTPPPMDPVQHLAFLQRERDPSTTSSNRSTELAKEYRDATLRVVSALGEHDVFPVDIFGAFVAAGGDPGWERMFPDGLHFDAEGGDIVFRALHAALVASAKGSYSTSPLNPEMIEMPLPHWGSLTA